MNHLERTVRIVLLLVFLTQGMPVFAETVVELENRKSGSINIESVRQRLEGKSLERIVLDNGLNTNNNSIHRKEKAQERFWLTYGQDGVPDINVYRSFLTRETLGLRPDTENFVVSADFAMTHPKLIGTDSVKYSILDDFFKEKSLAVGFPANSFSAYQVKLEVFSTKNQDNTGGFYNNPSVNSVTGDAYHFTLLEQRQMAEESAECKPDINILGAERSISRKEGMKCFQKFDEKFFQELGYTSNDRGIYNGLRFITSLVDEQRNHRCMASYYGRNRWITAAHCVGRASLVEGRYIVTDTSEVKIEAVGVDKNLAICNMPECDLAFIFAPTPGIDESIFVAEGNLALITAKTPILIPGIELYSPVIRGNIKILNENLLWPPVSKGYCKGVYQVENNCISHTCSTLRGFSGAPIYAMDSQRKINLIGIHSGEDRSKVSCATRGTGYAVSSRLFKG